MIARRSPNRSASAPNKGWPIPQARFWIAMASEKSDRSQPNSVAIGIWNTPKLARTAKEIIRITQPAIRTGVIRGVLLMSVSARRGRNLRCRAAGVKWRIVMDTVTDGDRRGAARNCVVDVSQLAGLHAI